MRPVQRWLAPCGAAVAGEVALLGAADLRTGLGAGGWVAALAALLGATVVLVVVAMRERSPGPGPADLVTLSRLVLACVVVGLAAAAAGSAAGSAVPGWVVAAVAIPALVLDGIDGWLARRTGTVTRLGARFDMETDALLILALSGCLAPAFGWWVLLIGLARYLLLPVLVLWPELDGELRPRRWRKVVAVIQGVALVVAATGVAPRGLAEAGLAGALGLLAVSFGTELWERLRAVTPSEEVAVGATRRSAVVTAAAIVLLWIALTVPADGADPSPWLLARVPVEGVALVGAAVLAPRRWADVLAAGLGALFGVLAAVLLLLKLTNIGFATVLDRPFDPVGDWTYLGSGIGVLADTTGRPVALALAALVGCAALVLCAVLPLAAQRTVRAARRHPGPSAGAGVGALALAVGVSGVFSTGWTGGWAGSSIAVAVSEAQEIPTALHDRSVFAREIAADRFAGRPGDQLLQRLRGKDVLLVFVESYGRSAVEHSSYAAGVDAVLDASTRQLRRAGYESRSGFLTSPTFGAASWLAHSTVQSGLWVDSQRRYDQLLSTDRLTLSRAFGRAGWRTVLDVPANTRDWPEGREFYHVDTLDDSRNVGYAGPTFGYAPMPDQYTLARFRSDELAGAAGHRPPVMAEIDLVSSHHPWAPLPTRVPWPDVGDGSVFDGMPEQGDTAAEVFSDPERVRQAYGQSIQYSIGTLVSFLTTYRDDVVVLMLGDHEPHHYVSGDDPGHDVPISLISRDPTVMAETSGWGWSPGLRPSPTAPVWRMDTLRDRVLSTFSGPLAAGEPPVRPHRSPR